MDGRNCPICGAELVVTLRPNDGRQLQLVCNECKRRPLDRDTTAVRTIGVGVAKFMVYAGILLTLLTLLADRLAISGGNEGFGWRQITGSEVGVLCLIVGFLAGRGLLATGGLFLMVTSIAADILRLGHAPGLGWRNQTALVVGVALLVGGMLWQLMSRKQDRPDGAAIQPGRRQ